MYPGKLLSLTNKGWGWAPLLKHVGFEWKKWGTCNGKKIKIKKERIARKFWRILEQLKWRSKDQNSKKFKKLKIPKVKQQRWWIQRNQRSNYQGSEEFKRAP